MFIQTTIIGSALLGLLLVIAAIRRLYRHHFIIGTIEGLSALVLLLTAALFIMFAGNLHTYQRLTNEQEVAEIQFNNLGPQSYRASITYPSGTKQTFDISGDEWQVDAKVIKWRGLANLLGFDTVYRLERLSGRYQSIDQERFQKRTAHELSGKQEIDLWSTVKQYNQYIPWVDALYGSATFLPMADGALYSVSVSTSGLVARPINQAARTAVSGWR